MTDTTTALDLDAIRPATDLVLAQLAETITQIKAHEHPASSEDFYCLNLTCWLGERMAPVLRRLADEQAATREWKARYDALANEFTAEVDRLRAQLDANAHEHHNRVTRLERYINGLETQCNTQMHELAAANEQIASMRAALDEADREQDPDKTEPVAEKNLNEPATEVAR